MKILVLTHEYPPVGGGGGHVAQDIASGLARRGHEIVLLTSHFGDLSKDEVQDGMRILRVPALRRESFRASFVSMAAYIARGLWAYLRLLKDWRPDTVHVHFAVPGGVLAWAFFRLTKIPYILTVHLGDVPGGAPEKTDKWFRWIMPLTHRIWRDAKQVVAVSEFTRGLALQHYDVDVKVIHNGVDLSEFAPGEIAVNASPRIIFAGRFAEQKNPLQIVRSLAEVKDLAWECVLIGDGHLGDEIKAEVHAHGMDERFNFPGWITPVEVQAWMKKSDILFMPSLSEGLPVVGVQAIAAGLIMLVSNIGGFVDLVDDGKNGFLVDKPTDYAEHLRTLLLSRESLNEMRLASIEKSKIFALDFIVAQYEAVLFQSLQRDI
jgi:glycosyltransferase involved in cell wall biosynthesis